jgi:predicted ATPase
MITQLKFHNFKVLREATLPLGRVTVIIGPNGSGKSTALEGIKVLADANHPFQLNGLGLLSVEPLGQHREWTVTAESDSPSGIVGFGSGGTIRHPDPAVEDAIWRVVRQGMVFSLDASAIASPSKVEGSLHIAANGGNLAAVLTTLHDQYPQSFNAINQELCHWMPEFDRIVFDTLDDLKRVFSLRTAASNHRIPAGRLSQGTLAAVCLLTLAHLPNPPAIIALEEIDRGVHPRLLRWVQDVAIRLAYPENCGENRAPSQVILTTHSPYCVDLFRDYPENIVIAEKKGFTASFHRLMDMPHAEEILNGAHLGDAWFAGILGGVPVGS